MRERVRSCDTVRVNVRVSRGARGEVAIAHVRGRLTNFFGETFGHPKVSLRITGSQLKVSIHGRNRQSS